MNIPDPSILKNDPTERVLAKIIITPLAPLSMVHSLPGSYYKTEIVPTKQMLCGLFENILGWHFCLEDRRKLIKVVKKYLKAEYHTEIKRTESESGYLPLIDHLFDVMPPVVIPPFVCYEDLWTQHLIGGDKRHVDGAINNDWKLESKLNKLKIAGIKAKREKDNDTSKIVEKELNATFTDDRGAFPEYYRSVPKREFITTMGNYWIKLLIQRSLFDNLIKILPEANLGYLGTSEGWVHVELEEINND